MIVYISRGTYRNNSLLQHSIMVEWATYRRWIELFKLFKYSSGYRKNKSVSENNPENQSKRIFINEEKQAGTCEFRKSRLAFR